MEYSAISEGDLESLGRLHSEYKLEIGEDRPSEREMGDLFDAIRRKDILFFGCYDDGRLVACCSVSRVFSTFDYKAGGVFEDFYILPEYRHRGIARDLVRYAYESSGISTMTVGCADCDREMYRSLGFGTSLGNLLAYGG